MPTVTFEGKDFALQSGETVLDCLERGGQDIPNACRSGVCHSCMLRKTSGELPGAAQKGLKPALQAQGYFLSCSCTPDGDLTVARAGDVLERTGAAIASVQPLNHRVIRVALRPEASLDHFPGQFVNFVRPGGLVRSFSIASVPALDEHLEFHVALVPDGQMSGWLHNDAQPGDELELQGPLGDCFYTPGSHEQPMLLIGTGTGLAPLYAIARDALQQGHEGPIHLYHGSLEVRDLYLTRELRDLAESNGNLHYHACVRDETGEPWMRQGAVDTVALEDFPNLKGWKVFLCGNPQLVRQVQRKTFMAGANMRDIHADAFIPAGGG